MKIHLASDIHLEFGDVPELKSDADVLILSGDICVADHFTKSPESPYFKYQNLYLDFFKKCADTFPHVLMVAGNHEHYHGQWNETINILKETLEGLVTVLDKELVTINGIKFLGGTMWTDCNKNNPLTTGMLPQHMNDYRIIKYFNGTQYHKLTPSVTMKDHRMMVQFIDNNITKDDKCIVVTHHAPSFQSIGEKYRNEFHMNGGYASDMSEFILEHPQIKLWTHGHVHHPFEYKIGDTLIACNPKGYPHEGVPFNANYVIEI